MLVIAGEGSDKENLEKLVVEYNLEDKVKFIGWIKDQKEFFSQIDIFLQPALSEPFGVTILEAFNYKTLVIACNADGPKEIIIDNYSGYLFEPYDDEGFLNCFKKAYLNQDDSKIIVNNAYKELVEKFEYKIMKKELLKLIADIVQ